MNFGRTTGSFSTPAADDWTMRTAINLYTVRDLDETMDEILGRVAAAGYDGVQFSGGFRGETAQAVREMLDSTGLAAAPAHIGIEQLETELEEVMDAYGEFIGSAGAVVPALGEENFDTRDAVDDAARRLSSLGGHVDDLGWQLHYHNHDFEFVDLNGETAFDHLLGRVDETVGAELDVGWARAGGSDPASLLSRHGDRVDLIHMKDVDVETRSPCEIGDGDVDLQACADAARAVDASWLIYEHDTPENPVQSIVTGAEYLDSL